MQSINVKFPNIPLTLHLKIPKYFASDFYTPHEIYKLLDENKDIIKINELGGEYYPDRGFTVQPHASKYDDESNRPYIMLSNIAASRIVWHSHPFATTKTNSFPSVEDLIGTAKNYHQVWILVTVKGIYIMRALKSSIKPSEVKELYHRLSGVNADGSVSSNTGVYNYRKIESEFMKDKLLTQEYLNNYGLFVRFIPVKYATNIENINKQIVDTCNLSGKEEVCKQFKERKVDED